MSAVEVGNEDDIYMSATSDEDSLDEYESFAPASTSSGNEEAVQQRSAYPEDVLELCDDIPRQFLPIGVKETDYVDVAVGEVYDPSKFWILINQFSDEWNRMMGEIQSFYASFASNYAIPEGMISKGLFCVAPYQGELHRAKIVNTLYSVKDKVKVYYIDCGVVLCVNLSTLMYLHRKFAVLPQQAIRARLACIYPRTEKIQWSMEASDRLRQIVNDRTFAAELHRIDYERQIVYVALVDTSRNRDICVNETLVDEGYAFFVNQKQKTNKLKPNEVPWVRYIHLYPTFKEIEENSVPSATDMRLLKEVGVEEVEMHSQYFLKKDELRLFVNY